MQSIISTFRSRRPTIAARSLAAALAPCLATAAAPAAEVTFSRDVAPIVYANCAGCHHAGGAGPFPLVDFAEVKKRAAQVVEVTTSRYMPPWQPAAGHGQFLGERRLSDAQVATFAEWVRQGTPEGDAKDLPARPVFRDGWQLGKPDLVLEAVEPYTLAADGEAGGKDVYRNFVVPIPLNDGPRYVRSVEIDPGNAAAAHHAFALFDRTREARRLDAADPAPGFTGMDAGSGAESPGGQFLSWQPGKRHLHGDPALAWRLEPGTDMVIQVHLRATGKPETVRPRVAIYFAEKPPARQAMKIRLASLTIDIPAGDANYVVQDSYRLPVDVEVREVLPHLHYLGKSVQGWAMLPDGTRRELLLIRNWDFNWQGEYRYAEPFVLPRGTTVHMAIAFDNSAANPRNPNTPPRRVTYGPQGTDEMAELWLQVVPRDPADLAILSRDFQAKRVAAVIDKLRRLATQTPDDAALRVRLGKALFAGGKPAEALQELRLAQRLAPENAEAHDYAGRVLLGAGDAAGAAAAFERAAALDGTSFEARNNLGLAKLRLKDWPAAAAACRDALRINPDDAVARTNLGVALLYGGDPAAAAAEFEHALRLNPDLPLAKEGLAESRRRAPAAPGK